MKYSGKEIREVTTIAVVLIVSATLFYYSLTSGQ